MSRPVLGLTETKLTKQIRNLGGKLGRAVADEFQMETVGELLYVGTSHNSGSVLTSQPRAIDENAKSIRRGEYMDLQSHSGKLSCSQRRDDAKLNL